MTFSERERFIFHATTAMTLSSIHNGKFEMSRIIDAATEGRCRHLTSEEIKDLYKEFEEEVLCSQGVFEELLRNVTDEEYK
jgi:hypothetical protein